MPSSDGDDSASSTSSISRKVRCVTFQQIIATGVSFADQACAQPRTPGRPSQVTVEVENQHARDVEQNDDDPEQSALLVVASDESWSLAGRCDRFLSNLNTAAQEIAEDIAGIDWVPHFSSCAGMRRQRFHEPTFCGPDPRALSSRDAYRLNHHAANSNLRIRQEFGGFL
eukprot:TRINITY_DN54884_c0_g1_i1.p1 TRINITY_DN54884_c0_g1~~TRINITY_DN54884_c0_g1_i1.p1  ORF type:complete len:170 (+),score=15.44 TRINITY_DN54884_c0_g1_i1:42-551(+)